MKAEDPSKLFIRRGSIKNFLFSLLYGILAVAMIFILRLFGIKILIVVIAVGTAVACLRLMSWLRDNGNLDFSKVLVTWLTFNGTGMAWCTYYLAYVGNVEIAETLSRYVIVELLAAPAMYYAKAGIENLSKNNSWPDKPCCTEDSSDNVQDL